MLLQTEALSLEYMRGQRTCYQFKSYNQSQFGDSGTGVAHHLETDYAPGISTHHSCGWVSRREVRVVCGRRRECQSPSQRCTQNGSLLLPGALYGVHSVCPGM